jgi:predicted nucleic acid-binding protein
VEKAALMKIIVDTDAFISLLITDDANHKAVSRLFFENKNSLLYVSPVTVGEAVTVVSNRISQKMAKIVLTKIRETSPIELEVNIPIASTTDEIFLKQNNKHTSWFDCLNVALYRYYHMEAIFSFDLFYKKMGLKILR